MTTANLATTAEATVRRALADYYTDFSTLELNAIQPYFHESMLLLNPQGVVSASKDRLLV